MSTPRDPTGSRTGRSSRAARGGARRGQAGDRRPGRDARAGARLPRRRRPSPDRGRAGLAKTLTIKTTAAVLGGTFRRVQFTPDLVPSDLVGTRIYRPDTGGFDTEEGPVFCNFLLADEINRAPAKVQSALLEVMQERQVTIGHDTHLVPGPVPRHGDPEPDRVGGHVPTPGGPGRPLHAQGRRGYPSRDEELTVVQRSLAAQRRPPGARVDALRALQRAVLDVYVDPSLVAYAVSLAEATRDPAAFGLGEIAGLVEYGASPRGPIALVAERAGAGTHPRPRLRARDRPPLVGKGCAAAPARAHVSSARRAADGR